jgi:predicted lipoprotein with Yx(FWY)xxD motif
MRFSLLPLASALAFAVVLTSVMGTPWAQPPTAALATAPGAQGPAVSMATRALQQAASPGPSGTCADYDSWCAYCAAHPGTDLCTPPSPTPVASTAPAATLTGSSTASTSPAAASAAPTAASPSTSSPAAASPSSSGSPAASASTPTVLVAQNLQLGPILTDAKGMTLYTRKSDMPGMSSCTGGCATTWPPLRPPSGSLTAPAGVTGKLDVITRDDGSKQVTYNGMPLYTYSRDLAPGDTMGQGIGGVWFVATP